MDRRAELTGFLKAARARVRPEDVGLPSYGERRRVQGLRREELALLAGVSVTHYTRLEQGQSSSVSTEVLDAIAAAMRFTAEEREYLGNLVHPPRTSPLTGPREVRPDLLVLMNAITELPAYVVGRHTQLLAWNRMTEHLFGDLGAIPEGRRSWSHMVFLDADFRGRWEEGGLERLARQHAAYLRLGRSRYPEDPEFAAMVDELLAESPDFRRLWSERAVGIFLPTRHQYRHPKVGLVEFTSEVMLPLADADQWLVTQSTESDSPSQTALRELSVGDAGRSRLV